MDPMSNYEPYHGARSFATMGLMTKGRAAWNVVTSVNDSEAAIFGHEKHLEHDSRLEEDGTGIRQKKISPCYPFDFHAGNGLKRNVVARKAQ
jgi:hypothetical protein